MISLISSEGSFVFCFLDLLKAALVSFSGPGLDDEGDFDLDNLFYFFDKDGDIEDL